VLTYLTTCALPETRSATARNNKGLSLSRDTRQECPKLRFRRRGCTYKYECKEECTEKRDCKTTYQYKCKEYNRQVCKDVWQNQCRGNKRRLRRSPRSPRRPYWLDKNNIETIFDSQNFPLTQSDLPLADPGQGSTYEFASPPKSKSCWKKVRKCEWKKYKTSCRNEPTVTCKPGTIKDCRNRCKNRWFCDKCPTTSKPKPKPTKKPVGPTRPPLPAPTRPSKPGPPAPPPLGTFIGPPGIPIKQDVDLSVIDVRRQKKLP